MKVTIAGNRAYTRNHEWVKIDSAVVEMGITQPILKKMGSLIALELPELEDVMMRGFPIAVAESMDQLHEIMPPADADIIDVNRELEWDLDALADDPYGKGWLMKIQIEDPDQLRDLLSADYYKDYCAETLGEECEIEEE